MVVRGSSLVLVLACLGCAPPPTAVDGPDAQTGSTSSVGTSAGTTRGPATTSTGPNEGSGGPGTNGPDTSADTTVGLGTGTDTTDTSPTGGDCMSDCPDGVCLEGACVSVASCLQLEDLDTKDTLPSGVYPLDPDGAGGMPAYHAYCELDYEGGGWTLVLKASGTSTVFEWDSALWTNEDTYQPEHPELDHFEAKLASYSLVPFTQVLVGMEYPIDPGKVPLMENWRWLVLPVGGSSMYSVISPGTLVTTALGRDQWKSLIMGSSLQYDCNREGLNVTSDLPNFMHVRIGIIANEQKDCETSDSRLGVGGSPSDSGCSIPSFPPHGNVAGCMTDNGDVGLAAFAAVFVR